MLPPFLSQYFLNPIGLLGLLGLLPLIAFYFFRPEPEERVMPSMAFFMEDEKKGKLDRAIEKLMKNLLLILHILMIMGIAAALAQLYVPGESRPDKSVIVLDRSASMSDDMGSAKKFVKSNLGKENTLIVAGEDVEVPLEKASGSRVRQKLGSVNARDVETDLAGALELASDYQGSVVVASDLDHTLSERSVEDILKNLDTDRNVRIMDADKRNSWGIIETDPGRKNSSVEVKNFLDKEKKITVTVNGKSREITVEGGAVQTVRFSSSKLNKVELEEDEMESDNSAYISVPKNENYKVKFVSDSGNSYFEKAIELIDFTNIETVEPPLEKTNADVYVIGETNGLLESDARKIRQNVKNGASLVVFAQPGLREKGLDFLPPLGSRENASVEIEKPRRINVGETKVYELKKQEGESLSSPGNAVRKLEYGEGDVLLYNIRDSDFHFDFLYPVFWKEMMAELTRRPSIEELNVRTGERIEEAWVETPSGQRKESVIADRAGFYNTSRGVYAATLASQDESVTEDHSIKLQAQSGGSKQNLQRFATILLAALAFLEILYLRYTGDI